MARGECLSGLSPLWGVTGYLGAHGGYTTLVQKQLVGIAGYAGSGLVLDTLNPLTPGALPGSAERLQDPDGGSALAPHRVPQVPVLLEAQPEVRPHPQHPLQPQRGVGGHAPFPAHDLVQTGERDPKTDGEGGLADPQRPEELLDQPFMLAEPYGLGVWGYCREGRLLRMAACQSR